MSSVELGASLWGQVSANRPILSPGHTSTNTDGVLHVAGWEAAILGGGFAAIFSLCLP